MNKKTKARIKFSTIILQVAILLFAMAFSGCAADNLGKWREPNKNGEKNNAANKQTEKKVVRSIQKIDVLEQGWKEYGQAKDSEEGWKAVAFQGDLFEEQNPAWTRYLGNTGTHCAWDQDRLFHLENYEERMESGIVCHAILQSFHTLTHAVEEREIVLSDWENRTALSAEELARLDDGIRNGHAFFVSMDAWNDKLFLCLAEHDEEWKLQHYYCMTCDKKGILYNALDIMDSLREREVGIPKNENELAPIPKAACNGENGICLVDEEKGRLYVLDEKGEELSCLDLGDTGASAIWFAGHALDGTPIFWAWHDGNKTLFFSPQGILYDGDRNVMNANLNDLGELFLWTEDSLVRWNVSEGRGEKLCGLEGLQFSYCMGMWRNSADDIFLAFDDGEECYYYQYGLKEIQTVELSMLVCGETNYLQTCAAEYSRRHPGTTIEISVMENPFRNEALLNRLAEEMKEGIGPDLLVLQPEQLTTLAGAERLLPLNDQLTAGLKENLFWPVLQSGTRNGILYGVPTQAQLSTLILSKDRWRKDDWTLQDAMSVYQKAREDGVKRFMAQNGRTDAQQLLYDLCLTQVENSDFLSLEDGSCTFDSEAFCEFLRFCKTYAETEDDSNGKGYLTQDEKLGQAKDGIAMTCTTNGDFFNYSKVRSALGEGWQPIGFPYAKGNGCTVECSHSLAISQFSEHQDIALDFLQYLLSKECQIKYGYNYLRKDVLLECVQEDVIQYDENGEPYTEIVFRRGSRGGNKVAGREDGTSYVKEFIDLMDHGSPMSLQTDIQNIIMEEADSYFAGAKSEREAAKIIQNRVQLYLRENEG